MFPVRIVQETAGTQPPAPDKLQHRQAQLDAVAEDGTSQSVSEKRILRRRFLGAAAVVTLGGSAMDSPVATCEEDTRDASVVSRHLSDVQSNNHVRYHYDRAAPYDYQGVMQGNPPPPENRVSTGNFYSKPEFLRWALCHMRELLPTQRISRGTRDVNVLPAVPTDKIDSMLVSDVDGAKISAREFLRKTDTDSFLVIKDGQILTEQYFAGAQPDRPQYLFSASKSLASTMIPRRSLSSCVRSSESASTERASSTNVRM